VQPGIKDTRGKFAAGVNYTDSKFVTNTPGVVDTGDKFANGKNNTSGN
jgi:hypothetical protein